MVAAASRRPPGDPIVTRDAHGPGPISEGDLESIRESVFVTGFPDFVARRLVALILARDPGARLDLLVETGQSERAREFAKSLPDSQEKRLEFVVGDIASMDLGLSGVEYNELAGRVTAIHHLAASDPTANDRRRARRIDVQGTRGVIELAENCQRLRRLCHWSTTAVSGKRTGVILEDELDQGQSFYSVWERTRMEAEKLAKAARRRLPVTIFRPSLIVGDSATGEFDTLDGPHYLMLLIATNATQMSLPLPGKGTAPLNMVPVDFAVVAAHTLSLDERAAGKTFHLSDPAPLPARQIFRLIAEHSHTRPPRGFIPGQITRALLHTPGIRRLARGPLSLLDAFDLEASYDSRNTQALLADTGIRCPPFDSYVDNLITYLRSMRQARSARRDIAAAADAADADDDALD